MAALPSTRVTAVEGAVVDHLDGQRRQGPLERGANLPGGGFVGGWLWHSKKVAYDIPNARRCSSLSQYFELHPVTPQARLIRQAAEIVRAGGVIAYPTDSCYALGWHIGDKSALERVRRIRRADRHHHFTLVCADLAQVGRFARLETWQFRLLKTCLPGPYTFLLKASRETPRRLQHERRRTIGVRVPDHAVPQLLLRELEEPLMSSTLLLPDEPDPLTSGREIQQRLAAEIDAVLDGGDCGTVPTTVVDLSVEPPVVVRQGRGPLERILGQRS
jgi:tRNA threonylcarbamoyl adenosine modification protein (Sua5/YciO/YrdC/YwlC family)